jgi:cell division protein FtsW
MSAFAVGFVILGNDLGTAMVYILMIAGALLVADIPMKWFASAGVIAAIVVAILALVSDNRMGRIMATYDSQCDSSDLCYQVTRGLEALGSGGLTGVGLGASSEKWAYLPEAQNDFIFAIIGEELGFLGALLVIVLFAALGVGMMRVVIRHEDPMVKISTAAIAAWILGQAIFNIGVVTRIFPVIGVPLPFVSAGGSALIATMLAIGLVLGFARTEPGAHDAFARKPSVVRKTAAIVARSTRSISRRS